MADTCWLLSSPGTEIRHRPRPDPDRLGDLCQRGLAEAGHHVTVAEQPAGARGVVALGTVEHEQLVALGQRRAGGGLRVAGLDHGGPRRARGPVDHAQGVDVGDDLGDLGVGEVGLVRLRLGRQRTQRHAPSRKEEVDGGRADVDQRRGLAPYAAGAVARLAVQLVERLTCRQRSQLGASCRRGRALGLGLGGA